MKKSTKITLLFCIFLCLLIAITSGCGGTSSSNSTLQEENTTRLSPLDRYDTAYVCNDSFLLFDTVKNTVKFFIINKTTNMFEESYSGSLDKGITFSCLDGLTANIGFSNPDDNSSITAKYSNGEEYQFYKCEPSDAKQYLTSAGIPIIPSSETETATEPPTSTYTIPETTTTEVTETSTYAINNEIATTSAPTQNYIANTNTHKFHIPSCSSVSKMKESNKMYHTGYAQDLISQGYSPCKNCHPK